MPDLKKDLNDKKYIEAFSTKQDNIILKNIILIIIILLSIYAIYLYNQKN